MTLHMNSCGAFGVRTYGGAKYFLTMTTTLQRYMNVELMNCNTEAVKLCMDHIKWL